MGKALLKWLAALGTGAATVVLAYVSENAGNLDLGDPFLSGIAVTLLTRLVTWLVSMIPPPAPTL